MTRCDVCGGRPVSWPRHKIVRACRDWAADTGGPPAAADWAKATPEHPSESTVRRAFGTWNDMLAEAGFTRRPRHRPGGRRFTRRDVRDDVTRFVYLHGRLPTVKDWRVRADGGPTSPQLISQFGSFNAAIVVAGYEPPIKRRSIEGYERQASAAAKTRDGDGRFA